MKGDTIYRQAAIDAVLTIESAATLADGDAVVRMSAVNHVLRKLPSAQPVAKDIHVPRTDTISRQAAIEALGEQPDSGDWMDEWECGCRSQWEWDKEAIENVPAAQPERKKGKWVEVTDGICIWKVCDQCGEKPLWNEWKTDRCESNYCPNCGSYNGGEQDE